MNRIFPIFISCVLFAQINVMTLPTRDIQDALFYERKGDIDKAKIIYQTLLEKNPKNRQAYQRLKEILKRTEELSEASELIKYWINIHPNDLQAHIELGEIFYLNNDRLNADKVWESFENNFGKNQSAYRMLLHTYSRLSLTTKMKELVYRGRIKFNKKDLLSLDLANYYHARQTYDLSLDELLIYIKSNPSNEKLVMDKILLISDEPENHSLIEKKLFSNLENNNYRIHKLLSGFYFKTGKYKDAYNIHLSMGLETTSDFQRWLILAENFRKEKQYRLSIDSYKQILSIKSTLNSSIIGEALLGLGKTYEAQLMEDTYQDRLVDFYPENIFFNNKAKGFQKDSLKYIESTFNLYQQILKELPASTFSSKAHYRLGELQSIISQHFIYGNSIDNYA